MRSYESSHPWLTFEATEANRFLPRLWMMLGEVKSACEQISPTPLLPDTADAMFRAALVQGAAATTAIEGNTLTTEQIEGILDGAYSAPPSRAYQQREVRNILDAFNTIAEQISADSPPRITAGLICDYNRLVLDGTIDDPTFSVGSIRRHSVVVNGYVGAPAEDCEYLLDRLADWLEGDNFRLPDPETSFALTMISALLAHLYLAWIHPFGDGNGRTARLLEFLILARSKVVPFPAAHLLSNHYNLTRDRYYKNLRESSRSRSFADFVDYAVEGFRDGLQNQMAMVRNQHLGLVWTAHVGAVLARFPSSPARDRQSRLATALPSFDSDRPERVVPRREMIKLTPELTVAYARTGSRTLSRDLNRLEECGLIVRSSSGWRIAIEAIKAFVVP